MIILVCYIYENVDLMNLIGGGAWVCLWFGVVASTTNFISSLPHTGGAKMFKTCKCTP